MLYYKVIHFFITKKADHIHYFNIGIYDTKQHALDAVEQLKPKEGFCLRPNHFYICRVLRFHKPKLLNRTYWQDGFVTYIY